MRSLDEHAAVQLSSPASDALLPLTCTRLGSCCHGKRIFINPWELSRLAAQRGMERRAFRDAACTLGGTGLAMSGPSGFRGRPACSQYDPASGCRAHAGRPLACRLYPLGRERRGETVRIVFEGERLPCFTHDCAGVAELPALTVADYLAGQEAGPGMQAQDAYLDVAADLAEGAFVLLFDSGLAARGGAGALRRWRAASEDAEGAAIPAAWRDRLQLGCEPDPEPLPAIARHRAALQSAAQEAFACLASPEALAEASGTMMGLALHCARSCGADARALAARWLAEARRRGAPG